MTAMPVTTRPALRVLLVDDHTLFRRGLSALLSRDPRLVVVGDAADAGEAQRRAQELQPDVILLDNHLPGVNGVDAIPALHDAAPQACILVLTVSEDEADLARALRNGAAGYLLKTTEGEDLIQAILKAHAGDNVIAPEMTNKLVAAYRGASHVSGAKDAPVPSVSNLLDTLSAREKEILCGITKGESNKEIGRNLGIAETTVKIHVQHILRKLGVSSRVHAAVMASENPLI
jgi:two-component system nitrate/nitrite response regulator NarL